MKPRLWDASVDAEIHILKATLVKGYRRNSARGFETYREKDDPRFGSDHENAELAA